jgi:hypothetical protein
MASLYQRGQVWWAKYRSGAHVVRVSTGCTKKRAAQDWLDIRAGKIAAGEPVPVKLDAITYDELRKDLDAAYGVQAIRSLEDAQRRSGIWTPHSRAGAPSTSPSRQSTPMSPSGRLKKSLGRIGW